MELSIPADPQKGLPPLAARRFRKLGYGAVVRRAQVLLACGSRRAGDLFIHGWARRGMLVPVRWGAYWIPDEKSAILVLSTRSSVHARLIATNEALKSAIRHKQPAGFLGPAVWEGTDLSLATPGLTLSLRPEERRVPDVAPQLEAFVCDLGWPIIKMKVRVGNLASLNIPAIHPADVAWILRLNMNPRIRSAGLQLISRQSETEQNRIQDLRRLANFPAVTASHARHTAFPTGPPHLYRVFAPGWYMAPHLAELQAEARRDRIG